MSINSSGHQAMPSIRIYPAESPAHLHIASGESLQHPREEFSPRWISGWVVQLLVPLVI